MKRVAFAATLVALISPRAEAQIVNTTPSIYSPGYYPVATPGYYNPPFGGVGYVPYNSGVVAANVYGPKAYYYNGVVPANTYGPSSIYAANYVPPSYYYNPASLYNSVYFNSGYYNYNSGFYPTYGVTYFPRSVSYYRAGGYNAGVHHRGGGYHRGR